MLRDRLVAYTVGVFIFTLLFALSAQNRAGTSVHQLIAFIAAVLGVFYFTIFFFPIYYALRLLRPISILRFVGSAGLAVTRMPIRVSASMLLKASATRSAGRPHYPASRGQR